MNKMIDLVLCELGLHSGEKLLFQAPAFSCLEKDDRVLVDTEYGESDAYVVSACTVRSDSDQCDMILACAGDTEPIRKVIGKTVLTKFNYEKGESEHE